jgi:ligand-binding sensor domain-containing protein
VTRRRRGFRIPKRPILLALLLCLATHAGRLPITTFTTADGLPHSRVNRIVRDSRGFLWFCTTGGVSRFDGERFTSYGPRQGLTTLSTYNLAEDRSGTIWVSKPDGGVYRFDPDATEARHLFRAFRVGEDGDSNATGRLYVDRAGRLWVVTDRGLFEDAAGRLWTAHGEGITIYGPGAFAAASSDDLTASVRFAPGDRFFEGEPVLPSHPEEARWYRIPPSLGESTVMTLLPASDGRVWIALRGVGVAEFDGSRVRYLTETEGLTDAGS